MEQFYFILIKYIFNLFEDNILFILKKKKILDLNLYLFNKEFFIMKS